MDVTDTPTWTRDLPFLLLASLFHALLLSVNPSIRWGALPRAAEKMIPVEFVSAPPPSPMLAPIPLAPGVIPLVHAPDDPGPEPEAPTNGESETSNDVRVDNWSRIRHLFRP